MTARNCSKSYIQSLSTYTIYLPNLSKLQPWNYLHWAKWRLVAVWTIGVSSTLSLCLQCCPLHWCIYNTFWCTQYICFLCSEPPNAQWSPFSFWKNKRSHLHLKGYLPSVELIATTTMVSHFISSLPHSPCPSHTALAGAIYFYAFSFLALSAE